MYMGVLDILGHFPFTRKSWNFRRVKNVLHLTQVHSPPGVCYFQCQNSKYTMNSLELVRLLTTCNFHRKVCNGKTQLPFENSFFPENFKWNEPKSRVPFTNEPEFPEFFLSKRKLGIMSNKGV